MDQVNQELILWLLSGFGAVISVLLGWIGVMQRETKAVITQKNDEQDKRLDKHDEKFDKVHQEIKGLSISIAASVKRRK